MGVTSAIPALTRFVVPIQPRDGSRHYELRADTELLLCPQQNDSVVVYDGVETSVLYVTYCPTQDPAVWVRCRMLNPATAEDAEEIVRAAKSLEGWRCL